MRILIIAGAVIIAVSQFLCHVYAIELCEPQDYYNLANATKCSIQSNKAGNKVDSQEAMFEIMKNYPFEKKDEFAKLLQRKIELVDSYKTKRSQKQTRGDAAALSKLERARQVLLVQLEMVNVATQNNWESVRDQARKALKETTRSLHEVE